MSPAGENVHLLHIRAPRVSGDEPAATISVEPSAAVLPA